MIPKNARSFLYTPAAESIVESVHVYFQDARIQERNKNSYLEKTIWRPAFPRLFVNN